MAANLTELLQIRVPKDVLRTIDNIAKARLVARSDIVREAILFYLKHFDKTARP